MLVRKTNRENPDNIASEEVCFGSAVFVKAFLAGSLSSKLFRTFTVMLSGPAIYYQLLAGLI